MANLNLKNVHYVKNFTSTDEFQKIEQSIGQLKQISPYEKKTNQK